MKPRGGEEGRYTIYPTPIWLGFGIRIWETYVFKRHKSTNGIDLTDVIFCRQKEIQPSHSAVNSRTGEEEEDERKEYVILRLTSRGVNSFRFTAPYQSLAHRNVREIFLRATSIEHIQWYNALRGPIDTMKWQRERWREKKGIVDCKRYSTQSPIVSFQSYFISTWQMHQIK